MKKIAVVGPESSGKSFLTKTLAKKFNADFTKEFAREHLQNKESYTQDELIDIAKGQIGLESKITRAKKPQLLFCDTNILSILVWSKIKYDNIETDLLNLYGSHKNYDFTLLLYPDLDYVKDPLRESPELSIRLKIFDEFESFLKKEGNYTIIKGKGELRIKSAEKAIRTYLNL